MVTARLGWFNMKQFIYTGNVVFVTKLKLTSNTIFHQAQRSRQGAIHQLRLKEEGGRWSKKLTICKLLYHRKCKRSGVGGQKKPNLGNVVCKRPPIL